MTNELNRKLKMVPDKPGAYMMKDERGEVIYVGKAASLRSRVRSYFQKGQAHPAKVLVMVAKVHDVDWLVTGSEVEALMLECNLIKQYKPHYNVRLRDDKHYPYLCVTTSEPFPRVIVVRRVKQDGNRYFGPYADVTAMRDSLRVIRKVFRIRGCNKQLTGNEDERPCLNHHMGQCDSPCSGRINQEEYTRLVNDACLFLEGRSDDLLSRLSSDMMEASENLEFERAARLRDQLDSLRKMAERQKVISTELVDQDIISASVDGETACIQIFFVRAGKLVGQEHFFLEGITDELPETALGEFIKQFYRDAAYVPREVLISHELADAEVVEEWLSLKRGSRVHLIHPKRGEKRRLVDMARENAALTAQREKELVAQDENRAANDLLALAEVLGMDEPPARIEAYDISNIQGRQAVGSMVVFENGVPAKSQYRRFKIRSGDTPDDYGMMREVIMRRFAAAADGDPKFTRLPNIVLIDGGRGQLNAALEGMRVGEGEYGREGDSDGPGRPLSPSTPPRVISLAKRLEEVYTPEASKPILLPLDSPALRLLQRVRDEAHRFALAYHHKLREKTVRRSVLDSIPGVGDHRRKALIRRFGSIAGVRKASLDEIAQVPGMNRATAEVVFDALHGGDIREQ